MNEPLCMLIHCDKMEMLQVNLKTIIKKKMGREKKILLGKKSPLLVVLDEFDGKILNDHLKDPFTSYQLLIYILK